MLFIDLDDFKVVNDAYSHDDGTAPHRGRRRIGGCAVGATSVARIGGDEFAVLVGEVSDVGAAERVAERILEALRLPVDLGHHVVVVRASIGIAISGGVTAEDLMKNADVAMYLAKSQGKDRHQLYDVEMHAEILGRIRIRSDLAAGHRIPPVRRPLPAHRGHHHRPRRGTEALARWQHPQRGLILPAEFIGVAESTGLIVPLGRQVLRDALEATRGWQDEPSVPTSGSR